MTAEHPAFGTPVPVCTSDLQHLRGAHGRVGPQIAGGTRDAVHDWVGK